MRAYIINLESASDRWKHTEEAFAATKLELVRVPAVDGLALQLPAGNYAESRFRRFHGRETNPFEIACYWSHVAALRAFLSTGDPYGLIGEDDIVLRPEFEMVLARAMQCARFWNILRLTGLSDEPGIEVARLCDGYALSVRVTRLKGAGAYLVDRKAAAAFVRGLLPMWLPYDHALDREWWFGLAAAGISPFPVSQTKKRFASSIQGNSKPRLSEGRRWAGTYLYQAGHEIARWVFRLAYAGSLKARLCLSQENAPRSKAS